MIKNLLILIICVINLSGNNRVEDLNIEVNEGSVIVAMITHDTIWLAADTKFMHINANNITTGTFNKTKIYQASNIFYGFTGLGVINYNNTQVDPQKIVEAITKKEKYLSSVFKIASDSILKEVNKFIDFQKLIRSNPLINRWLNSATIYDISMFTFENGKPNFFTKTYALKLMGRDLKIITTDSNHYSNQDMLLLTGHRKDIREYVFKNRTYITTTVPNMKERLVCLIKLQSEKDPAVGMPADVVTIYNNGQRWSLGNKECLIK